MAITFPLPLADFYDFLPIASEEIAAVAQVTSSGTEGGEILTAEVAPALWRGRIALETMGQDCADFIASRLSALEIPGRAFYATSKRRAGPQDDPTGATVGGSSVTLTNVDGSGQVAFAGLPAGFRLVRGDLFSFTYGSSPTRYALHRLVETGTADGSGNVSGLHVAPAIRTGWSNGDPVTLVNPICKAVIVPGSVNYGAGYKRWVSGMSFEWRQTLR